MIKSSVLMPMVTEGDKTKAGSGAPPPPPLFSPERETCSIREARSSAWTRKNSSVAGVFFVGLRQWPRRS